jgi:(4-(4-[2-(gamma-L-glutamylamino)ethyl]phenoxymethyl)furan-2-yl)methanamine synthase
MSDVLYVGWDIGGAHLKMVSVDADGAVVAVEQHATPLWQGLESLENVLKDVKTRLPETRLDHAVTTTGELADLFQNRQQGVNALLEQFCKVFIPEKVQVYAGPAGFIPVAKASQQYQQVASANWHATTAFVASQQGQGILVDIGSSTTDLVPFKDGKLCNRGYTDHERMRFDELLYTGIVRSPVMAIVSRAPFAGEWQTIAAEHFASMADVYRITGELDESHDLMPAADGGAKEKLDSVRRLARMLGTDVQDGVPLDEYYTLAAYIAEEQTHKINQALQRVMSAFHFSSELCLIGAGAGRFLAAKLATRNKYQYIDFEQMLNVSENHQSRAADCATAVSVAQLLSLAG